MRAITTAAIAGLLFFFSVAALAQNAASEHLLEVELSLASGQIRIDDRVSVSGRDEYRFRLAPWLAIESLELDGRVVAPQRHDQDYRVGFGDQGPHQLEFRLRGIVPARDGKQATDGMLSSNGRDGLFLPGYDAWIPLDVAGPMQYRMVVKLPLPGRAVATGRLVSEQNLAGIYQAIFETSQAGEAPSLFAGPYRVQQRISDGLRLRSYFHAELEPLSESYLDAAAAYIQRYQATIGPYPYSDFHIISAPLPVGLGFPNLTYVGRRVLPLPFMQTRSLAHEVLHNWWGNGIAVDYDSGNWAEGLTTYLADYALAADEGAEAARAMRVRWLRDYAALPTERDRPVRAFKTKRHQASQVIGYNKVAFIFHMLNNEIGTHAFNDGLAQFWREHKYRTAGWLELQTSFEAAAGRELDWFFRQWLERSGAPRLSIGAYAVEAVADGYRTRFEVLQPVTGYRFKLPLLLATTEGQLEYDITIDQPLTRVELLTPEKPRYLQLDPQSDVFRRLQRDETPPIMRDVRLDSATIVAVDAKDAAFIELAHKLADSLMDTEPHFAALETAAAAAQPLLLVTTTERLPALLSRLRLAPPPALPEVAHTAAVWTTKRGNGAAVMVIAVDKLSELDSLLRPLPHYGGQSYVLFTAGRALARGIWPLGRGALYRDLEADL